jgi:hypothetical protein
MSYPFREKIGAAPDLAARKNIFTVRIAAPFCNILACKDMIFQIFEDCCGSGIQNFDQPGSVRSSMRFNASK